MKTLVPSGGVLRRVVLLVASVVFLIRCSSDPAAALPDGGAGDAATPGALPDGGAGDATTAGALIGGTVSGLLGTGLVLQNNGGDLLPIASNGTFAFATKIRAGSTYDVTIHTQPVGPTQACQVSGGTGTVANGDVSSVVVNCDMFAHTVGGTVTGLAGTLVLQNNGGNDLALTANGSFAFSKTLAAGAPYLVTIKTQPAGQTCVLAHGAGTVGTANVTNVSLRCSATGLGGIDIITWKGDNLHTGVNASETLLTPALVAKPGEIGLLFNHTVMGQVYAQPLYKANVTIGAAMHNVVFIATESNYVYAFDADDIVGDNANPLWQMNLSPSGTTTMPGADTNTGDITTEIGITGTPVIDSSTNTLYVINKVKRTSNTTYEQYLNALDIRTGAHKLGSPVLITATYPGNGADNVGGVLSFNALRQHNRNGLTLHNGVVYAGFASHADGGTYHGWLIGFDAATLSVVKRFNTTPNRDQAGIWMAGASPAVDSAGNMFVMTGNGDVDPVNSDFGEALLKLPTTGPFTVTPSDTRSWFIPNNWLTLNEGDLDLGSGGLLILPDQAGPHPHLVLGGGKGGILYIMDRDNLGGTHATDSSAVQQIAEGGEGNKRFFCAISYFNGFLYYAPSGSPLLQRAVGYVPADGTYVSPTAVASNWIYTAGKGGRTYISANGTSDGIVWIIESASPSVLHAYDATSVAGDPIFSFTTNYGLAQTNEAANKFAMPIVSNGKIYMTASNPSSESHLYVLGRLAGATGTPAAPTSLTARGTSSSQIVLTWTDNAIDASGYHIERATSAAGPFTVVATTSSNAITYVDGGLNPVTTYYYRVAATNTFGDSQVTNTASAASFPTYYEPGLVSYWSFDEGTGSVQNDVTGHGSNGSNSGSETTWVPGVNDSTTYNGLTALDFHGAGNAVSRVTVTDTAAHHFTAGQSFTISAWVNSANVSGTERAIFAKSRAAGTYYGLWQSAANRWVFRGQDADVVGPPAVQNAWVHLAGVQDGPANTRMLYVNGALAATGLAQVASGNGDLWIGQTPLVPAQSFAGIIDEVRIYQRALSASEITNLKAPPALQTTSTQTQGSAGTFDKIMGPSPYKLQESRRGATLGTYDVVLNFSVPVSGAAATLQYQAGTSGTPVGAVGPITYSNGGRTATIHLTGVGNIQPLSLRLTGIQPGSGTLDVPFNVLWGDVNSDNVVNSTDVTLIQANAIATVDANTFQYDLNCDGVVNATDTGIAQALVGTNLGDSLLSLNKPATASSTADPIALATSFVDDFSTGTRWGSVQSDPQWVYIDLGQTCTVHSIVLNWENAGGRDYKLQISADANTWQDLQTVTGNTTVNSEIAYSGLNGVGRYVRMYGTARITAYGYSLWDFKVIGLVGP